MKPGKHCFSVLALAICLTVTAVPAAATLEQWASNVIDFSTQWGTGGWAASQTLGVPNTFAYGDISTAWAPSSRDGSLEYIILGYPTPVYATGAIIRETCGNGFVYQVDVLDLSDVLHTVWTGTDPSQPGSPVDFSLSWPKTAYLVKGLKIYIHTSHLLGVWEEIDAVKLRGNSNTVPLDLLLLNS